MAFPVAVPKRLWRAKEGKSLDLKVAEQFLLAIAEKLDAAGIVYHLEGGTLLGLVRDGGLLPWDKDLDISVDAKDMLRVVDILNDVLAAGWRIKTKQFVDCGALSLSGMRIIKFQDRSGGIFRTGHDYLDIIAKAEIDGYVYWQVNGAIMRVDANYYRGFDEIEFKGKKLKVPVNYSQYLTEKYGNWNQVVREWDCTRDEKCRIDTK